MIREFQVVTSGGTAEFGRASSRDDQHRDAVGHQPPRGRAYGFFRGDKLDARNPLDQAGSADAVASTASASGDPIVKRSPFLVHERRADAAGQNRNRHHSSERRRRGQSGARRVRVRGPQLSTGEFTTGYNHNE